jgi:phosphatidylglycerophosphatase A
MRKHVEWFHKIGATFFYCGYFPGAPGTFASAAAVFLYWILRGHVGLYLAGFAALTAWGFFSGGAMEKMVGRKDPGCIVIDEVSGVLISFFLLPPVPKVLWTAFFLFRAFDMFKIYPANKFEICKGGTGIMMDDIIAGIYTNLVMQIAIRLAGI